MVVKKGNYETIRPLLKSGDIAFIKVPGWIGKLISFMTFSRYSHVGIVVKADIEGSVRYLFVEAEAGASRQIVNLSNYKEDLISIVPAPKQWTPLISSKLLDHVYTSKYSILQAVYTGVREFFLKKYGIEVLPHKDFTGEICSEMVANIYDMPRTTSPQGLLDDLMLGGYHIMYEITPEYDYD